ncbi:LPS export ABC transporter ATP-binding protein [Candidatus Persebacteraceae bacterium Df01]|uniref:LPS export ABC transporter ATP-binding protein n=1 Tax=Candidatus Doriopsillibacter californiensis TaxID=2970740 RepID=A0ABT7QM21_9GAMM|nr:LPS export ABC transporter ATP-binding protein [Candidatus Persebacteraceae bacterium Df01]
MNNGDSLNVSGLIKRYDGRAVLNEVSIRVRRGEIVGLLGPNGAGKTTCFYAIAGLIRPDRGAIMMNDQDITCLPMHKRARLGLSYLPQEGSIFQGLNVLDNVLAIVEINGVCGQSARKKALQLLEKMGVAHLADASAQTLSGGERRRVEIARLLAVEPAFVLMDEPFAAIAPIAVRELQDIIRSLSRQNIGIVVTDHNVREMLKLCDRAYILEDGKVLVEGSPVDVAASEAAQRAYLGYDFVP